MTTSSIIQLKVLNQWRKSGGGNHCGQHAAYNSFLSILYAHDCITADQYNAYLLDEARYKVFNHYLVTEDYVYKNGTCKIDLSEQRFLDLIMSACKGRLSALFHQRALSPWYEKARQLEHYHWSVFEFEITKKTFYLGHISPVDVHRSLKAMSSLVQFLKSKQAGKHVLSIAVGTKDSSKIGHWITIVIEKYENARNVYKLLDSYGNQTLYQALFQHELDRLCYGDHDELIDYLIQYVSIHVQYFLCMEKPGYLLNENNQANAQAILRDGLKFLEDLGWLQSNNVKIKAYLSVFLEKLERLKNVSVRYPMIASLPGWCSQMQEMIHAAQRTSASQNPKRVTFGQSNAFFLVDFEQCSVNQLLDELKSSLSKSVASTIKTHAEAIHREISAIIMASSLSPQHIKAIKTALNLTNVVLCSPQDAEAIAQLGAHAKACQTMGVPAWKKWVAALLLFVSAITIGLSLVAIPFTCGGSLMLGASITGLIIGGVTGASGVLFFHQSRQTDLSKECMALAKESQSLTSLVRT